MALTQLKEMNFELLPTPMDQSGVVFGIGRRVSLDGEGGFDPGEDEWTDEDDTNPRTGGRVFGRETLNGPTWLFAGHTDEADTKGALEAISEIKTAWRASHLRDEPGAVTMLRYRKGGRTRRVYGRPRRFAAPPDNRVLGGFVPITMEFACATGYTYSDEEKEVVLQMGAAASSGGLVFPCVFPLTTLPPGDNVSSAYVDGDADAWPVVTFRGPLTNPVLKHENWTLSLTLSLTAPQEVTVDLRPWALTVRRENGQSVAGKLGRRQQLTEMRLHPGQNPLSFTASGLSGSGSCTVRWADTWNSI